MKLKVKIAKRFSITRMRFIYIVITEELLYDNHRICMSIKDLVNYMEFMKVEPNEILNIIKNL